MYGQVERDETYIAQLKEFLAQAYGISINSIIPAKRGWYGETWKIETPEQSYFAKLDYSRPHNQLYRNSFQVMERFRVYGIEGVSQVVKTASGELYTKYDGAVVGLFDWIDGENILDENITKTHEYEILSRVYTVPTDGLTIPRCDFSTSKADDFYGNLARVHDKDILNLFNANRDTIDHIASRLKLFTDRCEKATTPFFITHSDAGSNIMLGTDGKYYLIDWDAPEIAPPERNAWFFMNRQWAMDAFHDSLKKVGIDYKLNSNVLAYFCYHFWFLYLNNGLEAYFDRGNADGKVLADLIEYLAPDCWINKIVAFADESV